MFFDFIRDENYRDYISTTAYDYSEDGALYTSATDRCENDTDSSIKDMPTLYDYTKSEISILIEKGYEWFYDIPQIINTHTDINLYEFFELETRLDYIY